MIFVAENVLAITTICSTARRRHVVAEPYYISNIATISNSFSVSTGISLGQTVTNEIEDIGGVQGVSIKQAEDSYAVNVVMETIDFESFQKVVAKELELFDKHPGLRFDFNIDFAQNEESNLGSNAA